MAVTIEGPSKVKMDCQEVPEGYKVQYTPMAPGNYLISIKYGGPNHIGGSPFKAKVTGKVTTEVNYRWMFVKFIGRFLVINCNLFPNVGDIIELLPPPLLQILSVSTIVQKQVFSDSRFGHQLALCAKENLRHLK